MAFITGKTLQGNCGPVSYRDGRYHCFPIPDVPGRDPEISHQILFYAEVRGDVGETVPMTVHWPRYNAEKAGKQKYNWKSFLPQAEQCLFWSTDRLNWQRVGSPAADLDAMTLEFTLTLSAPVCYVAVNLYYTCQMFEALQSALAVSPFVEKKIIGRSLDGQALPVFVATDPSVPEEEKQHVWMQALQHCCEFSGGHVLDAVLRYLAGYDPRAAELRKKYVFHIMPVVSVGDWSQGYRDSVWENPDWGPGFDPNMDWDTFLYPETRAIRDYLDAQPKKPRLLLDMHNGGKGSAVVNRWMDEAVVQKQVRFAELLFELCDYLAPGRFWDHPAPHHKNFMTYASLHYGTGQTLEFSRSLIYDRALGDYVPLEQGHYARLAPQLLDAADRFCTE